MCIINSLYVQEDLQYKLLIVLILPAKCFFLYKGGGRGRGGLSNLEADQM